MQKESFDYFCESYCVIHRNQSIIIFWKKWVWVYMKTVNSYKFNNFWRNKYLPLLTFVNIKCVKKLQKIPLEHLKNLLMTLFFNKYLVLVGSFYDNMKLKGYIKEKKFYNQSFTTGNSDGVSSV